MYARTLIFVLRALQNRLQIRILREILIYFKKKSIKNGPFLPILHGQTLGRLVVNVQCLKEIF